MGRELTKQQKEVVEQKAGHFAVVACPGSGKTYTVAARFAGLLRTWNKSHSGIAAVSFTNVAWQEIRHYLNAEFGIPEISYPHFLGTIDSFLNTYVFLPLGHTAMACVGRPSLHGPPYDNVEPTETYQPWGQRACNANRCKLNSISFDADGNLACFDKRSHFKNCALDHKWCAQRKQRFNRSGRATQLDANFFAMKLLAEHEFLSAALAARFPVLIVDEAQDSSAIQMRVVELLSEGGLADIALVGDPDQAIYEWRTAEPGNLIAKYEAWKANSTELDKNWRSTKSICSFASRLSERAMESVDATLQDPGPQPQIIPYSPDDLTSIVGAFAEACNEHDCDLDRSAVLCRARKLVPIATGVGQATDRRNLPWKPTDRLTRNLVLAAYLRDNREWLRAFRLAEKTLAQEQLNKARITAEDLRSLHKTRGFSGWRTDVLRTLRSLPCTRDLPLGQWVDQARAGLSDAGLDEDLVQIKATGKNKDYYRQLSISQLVGGESAAETPAGLRCDTVHASKGQTLDGVLLVVGGKAGGFSYKTVLASSLSENEELRIIYVAITRARKLLWLTVPEDQETLWKERFGETCESIRIT